jgi:conjugal transfer mating pair stabilization protein TraG
VAQPAPKKIDPAAYGALLNVIATGESSGNYNAHFGNAGNSTVRFTEMSVAQVLQWQEEYVRQGSASSAVGRYQIVRPTLVKLVQELRLDTTVKFDERLQDRMAIALLERRGSLEYADEKLSREQFAANLSQEWAALPKVMGANPQESYYAGDGINESRISIEAVYRALDALNAKTP